MFIQVVRAGSFAEAARRAHVPPNTLSRRVRQLEDSLDTRLMQRSTRRLVLTEAGSAFYNRCAAALDDVLSAGSEVTGGSQLISGTVRVAAPADFLDLFGFDWVQEFLAVQPRVRLDFALSDARVDLIAEAVDVAFRAGAADDLRMYRKLTTQYFKLVASPSYLQHRGMPQSPKDLEHHDCLTSGGHGASRRWVLTGPAGSAEEVRVSGRLSANSARNLLRFCVAGLGIALLPNIIVSQSLLEGRLMPVLPQYRREGVDLCVVLPSVRQIPPAVAAFIDFAAAKLQSMISTQEAAARRGRAKR